MSNIDEFTTYDRVSDIVLYFSADITLKFVTQLAKNIRGNRRFFQYEVEKQSSYNNGVATRNINRNMDFFYVINNRNDFLNSFIIKPQDAELLLRLIEQNVLPWYQADNDLYAFQYINDTLTVTTYDRVIYTQTDTKHLTFDPIVMKDQNDMYYHAISITVNGIYSFEIDIEKFMGFVYFLRCDMYTASCCQVNYAKTEPYGVEVFRPYGLGGGQINDTWGEDDSIKARYSSIETSSAEPPTGSNKRSSKNSFLDNL